MTLGLFALGTFLGAFLCHVCIWHARLPARQTRALVIIFMGSLPAALLLAAVLPPLHGYLPVSGWEYLLLLSFHVPLSLAYIALYSAIETDSPSCLIVARVAQAGVAGSRRQDLVQVVGEEQVMRRIRGLIGSGIAAEQGGLLQLLPRGRSLASAYAVVDAILGGTRDGGG